MSYETKEPNEAHRKYADIQTTLIAPEGIAVVATGEAQETVTYDDEKDVAFFETPETIPILVDVYPGSFVLLLPQDCHMSQLAVGLHGSLKKW